MSGPGPGGGGDPVPAITAEAEMIVYNEPTPHSLHLGGCIRCQHLEAEEISYSMRVSSQHGDLTWSTPVVVSSGTFMVPEGDDFDYTWTRDIQSGFPETVPTSPTNKYMMAVGGALVGTPLWDVDTIEATGG